MIELAQMLLLNALYGEDGEGDGSGNGNESNDGSDDGSGDGASADGDQGSDSDDPASKEGEGDGNTFSREYVVSLRAENAKHRNRAKAAEDKLAAHEREQMTESERIQAERDSALKENEELKAQMKKDRLAASIRREATAFIDPDDAVERIDLESITLTEDGKPHKGSITSALQKLAKEKPYLLASGGSGDGGKLGRPDTPDTPTERSEKRKKELLDAGNLVEIPGL